MKKMYDIVPTDINIKSVHYEKLGPDLPYVVKITGLVPVKLLGIVLFCRTKTMNLAYCAYLGGCNIRYYAYLFDDEQTVSNWLIKHKLTIKLNHSNIYKEFIDRPFER
jgi:hypothetical protein